MTHTPDSLREPPPFFDEQEYRRLHADAWEAQIAEAKDLAYHEGFRAGASWGLSRNKARIEALEQVREAAQALSYDVHACYPEGLAALDGLRPLIETLDAALASLPEKTP